MNMKEFVLFMFMVCCLTIFPCCKVLYPDEKLSMKRVEYNGNQLRIDGYYYYQHDNPISTLVLFLYRNGVILSTRAYPSHDLDVVEEKMLSEYDKIRKEKAFWGVFLVNDNKIEYEKWESPTEGFTISKRSGYIEDDTTFHITKRFFSYNKKTYHADEIWHFKQFSPKPDSTNNYIK